MQREAANLALPGIRPVGQAGWVTVDRSYSAQILQKRVLLADKRDPVLAQMQQAHDAVQELLVEARAVICPDGRRVSAVISQLLKEDIAIHQPMGAEYGMTAALLCFPAS